jgi:hypothetical protein
MVFVDGFLFSIKELGLLTNLDHWVRFFDVIGVDNQNHNEVFPVKCC